MTITDLINLLTNRVSYITDQRAEAFGRGDAVMVNLLDQEKATTLATLGQLQGLAQ